jgi:hypothetical protein
MRFAARESAIFGSSSRVLSENPAEPSGGSIVHDQHEIQDHLRRRGTAWRDGERMAANDLVVIFRGR